jgi:hypothetical protein
MVSLQKLDCTKIDSVPSYFQLPPTTLVNSIANLMIVPPRSLPAERTDAPPTIMLKCDAGIELVPCKFTSIL